MKSGKFCILLLLLVVMTCSSRAGEPNAPVVRNVPIVTNSPVATNVPTKAEATNAVIATTPTNAPAPSASLVVPALSQSTNAPSVVPSSNELTADLISTGSSSTNNSPEGLSAQLDRNQEFQAQLELAREQRRSKNLAAAMQILVSLLNTNAPPEIKRPALLETAFVAQDDGKAVQAQQIYAQYLHLYSGDPSAPEVLLRQGLLYRDMGVTSLAISKFYTVMSSALKLKLENIDYYKKLVLQAQIEIAETYYLEGNYEDSADFFTRLLKSPSPELNKVQIQYKLIRSLSFLTNNAETVAKAQVFLDQNPNSSEVPEIRFLLASTLKKLGRNQESMKQVLMLLKSQQENVKKNPDLWIYWQQRAGNDIANQLYKEGDYLNALEIYLNLADLNESPAWQLPVWYQSAMVYEQLQQWQKADAMYDRIISRRKELTDTNATPSLTSLLEMAKWRKDYIKWMQQAKVTNQALQTHITDTNDPPPPIAQ